MKTTLCLIGCVLAIMFPAAAETTTSTSTAEPTTIRRDMDEFLPSGAYRKISGGDDCLDGNVEWLEDGTLKFGDGANPQLFHSFNSKSELAHGPNCVTTTETKTKRAAAKPPTFTIDQVVTQNCGGKIRRMQQTLLSTKRRNKISLSMTLKDSAAKERKTKSPLQCGYERSLN